MIPETDWIYDIETYFDLFCIDLTHVATRTRYIYEISDRTNDAAALCDHLRRLGAAGHRMFGFNNVGFDYPVLHYLMTHPVEQWTALLAHQRANQIIGSFDRFSNTIWPNERMVTQGDLFLIHHFDNPARSTSLKKLEVNMRASSVVDLPYPPDKPTTSEQKDEIIAYMCHDVSETLRFYHASLDQIRFRDDLAQKYPDMGDVLNMNDTKIGKVFFEKELERNGTPCREYRDGRRRPRQTMRESVPLRDVISPRVSFTHPEFQRVLTWLQGQTLVQGRDGLIETKGVFDDVSATIDGFRYDFGTGGIHGSVESTAVHATDGTPCHYCSDGRYTGLPGNACENCMNTGYLDGDPGWEIWDWDVASYYPNLSITNGFFPAHLSRVFCTVYENLFNMRQVHAKGTAENKVLKDALNGVYGDSNNKYSVFYDPAYTMSITINGQLLLCMLAEWLRGDGIEMIQINTDGLTVRVRRDCVEHMHAVCAAWQDHTGLALESAQYRSMFIRDVNSYLAVKTDGSVKRIGAYAYETPLDTKNFQTRERGWHQDHSNLVSRKAAEAQMVRGVPVDEFIKNHRDPFDFQLSVKVPRSSRLLHGGVVTQNTTRYYVSTDGDSLVKVMPPLKGSDAERHLSIQAGWRVTVTNDMSAFRWDNVNWYYYINEARKLVI